MDSPAESYEQSKGPSPMEMVTLALGGCTGMDVVDILLKRRVDLKDLQVVVNYQRQQEHPRVLTEIEIEYTIKGKGIKEEDVALAVNFSKDKYCSISKMLEKTAQITHKWKIVNQ